MHIDALIHTFRLLDIVDIIIVAIGIYYLYKLLKDTRAVSLLKGLVILAIFNLLSHLLNLYVINWYFATKYDRSSLCVTRCIPT